MTNLKKPRLVLRYGKLDRYTAPDIIASGGPGTCSADRNLLLYWMCCLKDKENMGFLSELEKRGYDITTVRFSIDKKPSQS